MSLALRTVMCVQANIVVSDSHLEKEFDNCRLLAKIITFPNALFASSAFHRTRSVEINLLFALHRPR